MAMAVANGDASDFKRRFESDIKSYTDSDNELALSNLKLRVFIIFFLIGVCIICHFIIIFD